MCREVIEALRRVDILVNNAGVGGVFPVVDYPEESWHKIMAANLNAPFVLAQQFLPGMRQRGWGRIINISSIYGLRAGSGRLAYGTSKTALIGLTRPLAIDTAEWGITVNAIAPGTIETPVSRNMVSRGKGTMDALMRLVPMNRCGTPLEIAGLAAFLASEMRVLPDRSNHCGGRGFCCCRRFRARSFRSYGLGQLKTIECKISLIFTDDFHDYSRFPA